MHKFELRKHIFTEVLRIFMPYSGLNFVEGKIWIKMTVWNEEQIRVNAKAQIKECEASERRK
jgi:hypothetical protein